MAVAVKIVTNLWSFLTNFHWYLQSKKLTTRYFYSLDLDPVLNSTTEVVSLFRSNFQMYMYLQLFPTPSSRSAH